MDIAMYYSRNCHGEFTLCSIHEAIASARTYRGTMELLLRSLVYLWCSLALHSLCHEGLLETVC